MSLRLIFNFKQEALTPSDRRLFVSISTSNVLVIQMHALPETGYLRLHDIIGNPKTGIPALIPVGKSTWWKGVQSGRYPKPTRALGLRITAWRVEDIRALIDLSSPK